MRINLYIISIWSYKYNIYINAWAQTKLFFQLLLKQAWHGMQKFQIERTFPIY